MKTLRFISVSFVLAMVFAVSAFAQTAASGKIGVINTQAFDSKDGITKYINAMKTLETEFKPDNTTLQTLGTRIQTLQAEIQNLQKQVQDGKVPVDEKTVNAKLEEYDKLTREYKFKQEDATARFERRQSVVIAPISQDIGTAIRDFAAKNGYVLIFDASKLRDAGLMLAFDEKSDVTKDFIAFYNTRPAGAATAAK